MRIIASPRFLKAKKKAPSALQKKLDEAVHEVMANPEIGDPKRGDLLGVRVFKFKAGSQLYLLAYGCDGETLSLYAWGVHENFYRDIKR
jgi:hypothetical protein